MSYQVLARKWRPQTFSKVVGQKHVLTALVNGLSLKRIHHAYLFSGTQGVGKTSIARLLAKGLNCKIDITATPCGVCDNCREVEQGRFVDLIEIDAASRTKVEDTRDLLDNIQYAPVHGRFKIYLIDEVHMLTRHSFNALLKTLEEPPVHVKFLLATTDPQKLPATILSRCLQFHLKTLDVEQICTQLMCILDAENVDYESRAVQLLARAANGSLRDALSLTDQAIAIGNGKLTTESVSAMLGILDGDQALSLIEAIINSNGEHVLSLVDAVAARGIEWEALLVEILALLHRIAMLQLSTSAISTDMAAIEQRLRNLARTIPPTELQLYYQTFLIGRKELLFAPSGRIGVEMTLLRALAFHPRMPLPESEVQAAIIASEQGSQLTKSLKPTKYLSDASNSVFLARDQLQNMQNSTKPNKSKSVSQNRAQLVNNHSPKQLTSIIEHTQYHFIPSVAKQEISAKKEVMKVEKPKALKKMLEYEKTSKLIKEFFEEAATHDAWTAEVNQLQLPKLVKQVALNAWKEQNGSQIILHLRSDQWHLNCLTVQNALREALAELQKITIELIIVKDDNPNVFTPLEWCLIIYEEKLAQARETIIADKDIQTIRKFFDADLDEDSIYLL